MGSTAPGAVAKDAQGRKGETRTREAGGPLHRVAGSVADSWWGTRAAQVGLAARGVVYLVLAYLVARIALGALGGSSTSQSASGPGVAQAVAAQTAGRPVLVVLAVGLVLYALFSILDAVLHHDDESPAAKRWGDRALSAWGFVVYGAFSAYCFSTAFSSSAGKQTAAQSDRQHTQWSADVLNWPVGWLWLGLLGGILLLIAVFLLSRAARLSFRPRLDRDAMSPLMWTLAMMSGAIGYGGRALLFGLVGWFILGAAIENDPSQGQGVDGAARLFARSAAGPYVLWMLAAALAIYGLYLFVETRFRHV
jgi:uncharacterized protein DUF1206